MTGSDGVWFGHIAQWQAPWIQSGKEEDSEHHTLERLVDGRRTKIHLLTSANRVFLDPTINPAPYLKPVRVDIIMI
ncbi:MAG: hypothetical protein Fur005_42430 [Roseiflexaceae bacterium]